MDRKPCWTLVLCLIVAGIVGVLGYIHLNRDFLSKLTNEMEFVEAAVRQTEEGIENYNLAIEQTQKETDNADKEINELQDEVGKLTSSKEEKDVEVKACKDSVAGLNNDVTAVEKEKSDTDGNFAGEKTKWSELINGLKQQLQDPSPVCAYAKIPPEDLKKDPTLKDLCSQIGNSTAVSPH